MDAGDYDGDADVDLVLGNFSRGLRGERISPLWNATSPLTVLTNTLRSPSADAPPQ